MSQPPHQDGARVSSLSFSRKLVLILVALNALVFGALFIRLLFGWFFAAPPDVLLLQGLMDEKARLESLAAGPCNSEGMESYRRGHIGPLTNSDHTDDPTTASQNDTPGESGSDVPNSGGQDGSGDRRANEGATSGGQERPSGSVMLPPSSLRSLVDRSVVRVLTKSMSGTGFAIGPRLIVTNRHVIESAGDDGIVVTSKYLGQEPVEATLLTSSPDAEYGNSDFAVLQTVGSKELTPLNLGRDPQPLENVIAAGFPGISIQSDSNEVIPDVVFSQGDVSVVQPQPNGISLVVHTANIAPGSSGGPLINRCGTVVGVNTFVSRGNEFEGRALYSLSAQSLTDFLHAASISYERPSSANCASGAN